MDVILNDSSLTNQFATIDDFEDSLVEHLLPVLKRMSECSTIIHKSSTIYDKIVAKNTSLHAIITRSNTPTFTHFKNILLKTCFDEPYFENDSKSDTSTTYSYDKNIDTGEIPNCFSEAFERDNSIFSFEHDSFKNSKITIKKSDTVKEIQNIYNLTTGRDYFFENHTLTLTEYLNFIKYYQKHIFFSKNDKFCTDNEYNSNKLTKEDIKSIGKSFATFQEMLKLGSPTAHFTDSITHDKKTYYEFRCKLSNKREFRIYYHVDGNKHIYLNSYLKDQKVIPKRIKDMSVTLIKEYNTK